jgi:tetratricopeptide (TPR) repeat protein
MSFARLREAVTMMRTFEIRSRVSVGAALALLCLSFVLAGCAQDLDDLRVQAIDQFRARQYVESMATLRQILEIERSDAEANYYMGMNYRAMAARKFRDGDIPAARRELDTSILYFAQAIKSWPNYMAAADAKNEAFEARGKYDEALAVTHRVAQNNRGISEHFVVLANEYRERGDYDNALRCYKLALSTAPDSSRAYSEMGRLYLRVGDRVLAMDAFRKAYELNSAEPGVADTLAQLDVDYDTHTASHNAPPARPAVTPNP